MEGLEAEQAPGVVDYYGGFASEVSSSYPTGKDAARSRAAALAEGVEEGEEQGGEDRDDDGVEEEELELGLSLGAKKVSGSSKPATAAHWGDYCRILTAKDFPSLVASRVSPISSSSSVSSSSSLGGRGGAGSKRAADSVAPEVGSNTPSPVVGWPPIRAYRINSLVNQTKDNRDDSTHHMKTTSHTSNCHHNKSLKSIKEKVTAKDLEKKGLVGCSPFVKVNMDGMLIGRKVDLNAHRSYESLALTLEDMFHKTTAPLNAPIQNTRSSKLLDGSSEYVLTYEDKDGDWMLMGDVPWGMFLSTVRRLRIMRTSDANGLSPRFQSSKVGV